LAVFQLGIAKPKEDLLTLDLKYKYLLSLVQN